VSSDDGGTYDMDGVRVSRQSGVHRARGQAWILCQGAIAEVLEVDEDGSSQAVRQSGSGAHAQAQFSANESAILERSGFTASTYTCPA